MLALKKQASIMKSALREMDTWQELREAWLIATQETKALNVAARAQWSDANNQVTWRMEAHPPPLGLR